MSTLVFNPFTNKLDFVDETIVPPGTVQSITGDTGGPISPTAGTINIQGDQAGHLGAVQFNGTGAGQIYATVLVDGTTIDINGSGQLTVLSSGNPFTDESGDFTAAINNGYFCSTGLTATLPASPSQGDLVTLIVTDGTITVQANTGQSIQLGSAISSIAGTAANTLGGDTINLRYHNASTIWFAESFIGNWSVA